MSVLLSISDSVAVITLKRPEALNALDVGSLHALRRHLCEARDRDDVRAIVLTGEGKRAFCTGADLKGTASSSASYAQALFQSKASAAGLGLYVRLMDLSDLALRKPIVAAINGHCLGGGLEMALQCDIRIAAQQATFGLPEVALGSIPAVSGLHRLLRAIPSSAAMQMVLTGQRIAADQALSWGLVSEVCEADALAGRAVEIAGRIAEHAPLAVQAVKALGEQTAHLSYADAQQLTELYWGVLRDTEDRREGRAAFAQKRQPQYVGR